MSSSNELSPQNAAQPHGHRSGWLRAIRVYLTVITVANLVWEALQVPLYGIWSNGTPRELAFAVLHCPGGDILIAVSCLIGALTFAGNSGWPLRGLGRVVSLAILSGGAYTAFSEWLNVQVRASWAYSVWMPVIPLGSFDIGGSPLLQWISV